MKINILGEAGYDWAMLGITLSYNSTLERAKVIAPKLAFGKPGENKFLEGIFIGIDITAPRYFWQEADTYRISTKQSECFSDDTEVLTDCGWFLFKNVPNHAKYATLNLGNNTLEYQYPSKVVSYFYRGNMIHFKNTKVDLLVTPDHDVVGNTNILGKPRKYNAKIVKRVYVPKQGVFVSETVNSNFILPEITSSWDTGCRKVNLCWKERSLPIDSWLWFLGFFIAEGRTEKNGRNYNVYLYQNQDSPSCSILEQHLEKLGFSYTKFCKEKNKISGKVNVRWTISNKQLYTCLSELGNTYSKHIPEYVFELSGGLQKLVFDGMFAGDGTKKSGIYTTVSKQLADDTQRLLRNAGISSNIFFRVDARSRIGGIYAINPQTSSHYVLSKRDKYNVYYDSKIYCVEVPNGTLYTRRNGKAIWSGNSTIHTLTKQKLTQAHFESPILDSYLAHLQGLIDIYKACIDRKEKRRIFKQLKNDLPDGFLQRRIWTASYKTWQNVYIQRHDHTLDEWLYFCNYVTGAIEHPEFIINRKEN